MASPAMGARAAGKPRKFWISLVLGVVTLGVCFWVWNYKAFRELDQEHAEAHASNLFWTALALVVAAVLTMVILVVAMAPDRKAGQSDDDYKKDVNKAALKAYLYATPVFPVYIAV